MSDQNPVGLNPDHRRGQVNLELRLENLAAAEASKAELSVMQPADSRLQVTPVPKEMNLSAESSRLNVEFELSTEGSGSKIAPPSEFFVGLRMENGRTYRREFPSRSSRES